MIFLPGDIEQCVGKCLSVTQKREWTETREALDILQGTGQTTPQRPTFPRRSIVLRLRNPQLKNFCIINSYTFLQPASQNLEHFTFVRSISELLCYLFKSPNPNQCDSSLTLCVCVCVCVKEVFIVFQTILDFGQRLIHLITIWTSLYYFMPTCYMPIILPLSTFQMISFLITVSQLTFEQWFGY